MPRGYPDYSNPTYEIAARSVDIGILMLAVSGVNSIDGLGRIWSIDNFGDGFDVWRPAILGDAVLPVVTTDEPEASPASVEMDAGTLAGNGNSYLSSYRFLNAPTSLGLQVSWLYQVTRPSLYVYFNYTEAAAALRGWLILDCYNGELETITDAGDLFVASLGTPPASGTWVTAKVVVDFYNSLYKRISAGQSFYDLSAYGLPAGVAGGEGVLYTTIQARPNPDTALPGYLGHVIYSLDEP